MGGTARTDVSLCARREPSSRTRARASAHPHAPETGQTAIPSVWIPRPRTGETAGPGVAARPRADERRHAVAGVSSRLSRPRRTMPHTRSRPDLRGKGERPFVSDDLGVVVWPGSHRSTPHNECSVSATPPACGASRARAAYRSASSWGRGRTRSCGRLGLSASSASARPVAGWPSRQPTSEGTLTSPTTRGGRRRRARGRPWCPCRARRTAR